MALNFIYLTTSENETLTIYLIDKYSYNVIGNSWDPMEDVDPIYYNQTSNIISKCFFIIIYLKIHQKSILRYKE